MVMVMVIDTISYMLGKCDDFIAERYCLLGKLSKMLSVFWRETIISIFYHDTNTTLLYLIETATVMVMVMAMAMVMVMVMAMVMVMVMVMEMMMVMAISTAIQPDQAVVIISSVPFLCCSVQRQVVSATLYSELPTRQSSMH